MRKMRLAVCVAVVFYCHSFSEVEKRFLYRAQDQNMTNGDFAFFTFQPFRTSETDQPWQPSPFANFYDDGDEQQDLPRRQRAFYAVKQVPPVPRRSLLDAASTIGSSLTFHIWRVCCDSNEYRAPIANRPNRAQLGRNPYHCTKFHPGPFTSVDMR